MSSQLKYAGKAAEISDVKIATMPVRVALVIADRGTGMFQAGTLHFVNALLSKGEFSITGVVAQPERFADYSSDVSVLKPAVIQLQRRSTSQGGAQLVDAILTAAKEVKKEGFRPAIVVMRAGGEAPTPTRSETVREEIAEERRRALRDFSHGHAEHGWRAEPHEPGDGRRRVAGQRRIRDS